MRSMHLWKVVAPYVLMLLSLSAVPALAQEPTPSPGPTPPVERAFATAGGVVTMNRIVADGASGNGGSASVEIGLSHKGYLEGRFLLSQIVVDRDRVMEVNGEEYPVEAEFFMLGGGLSGGYRGERGGFSGGLVGTLHSKKLCPKDAPDDVREEACKSDLLWPILPTLHVRAGRLDGVHVTAGLMERGATHLDYVRAGLGFHVGSVALWGGAVSGELGGGARLEAGWCWRYASVRPAVSFGNGESGSWAVASLTIAVAGGPKPGAP